jgi:hypothetical protein
MLCKPVLTKRVVAMKRASGERCTSRAEIAETFASFYEELYDGTSFCQDPGSEWRPKARVDSSRNDVEVVTPQEVGDALKKLKAGKTCGDDGLFAEMLKTEHCGLIEAIATAFTGILRGEQSVPDDWCISKLVVLFKKGDAALAKNYRPVAIIPVLNKLFCGIILSRIKTKLNDLQPPEQAGFRPDYSCSDVVHCLQLVAEKCDEWGLELWVASLDLEKAFDRVYHSSVIECLMEAEVDQSIILVLRQWYQQLSAYVYVDSQTLSRMFRITRGVRQGDPLSPLLFNTVTRKAFDYLKQRWAKKGYGTMVGSREDGSARMTHAMFADDTTLLASSREELTSMIRDVKDTLAKHGLSLNLEKCSVQTNSGSQATQLEVDGVAVPIVTPSQGFKILGTKLTLHGRTSAEVTARINAGWAKFHQILPLIGRRDGQLKERLRLFDMCVTQTVLWCCESWNLTQAEKRRLQTVQNDMLRRIAGPRRGAEEEWLDWIKRSTRKARTAAKNAGVRFWVEAQLQKKWSWAGHVLRMSDDRLAKRSTIWRDSSWWALEEAMPVSHRCRRPRKTRWCRWEDELRRFACVQNTGVAWQCMALRKGEWLSSMTAFIKSSLV